MPTSSFFAIRVKSHVKWAPETEVNSKGVWPLGSWVGSEEVDGIGPPGGWIVKHATYIGDADLYSSMRVGQGALVNLAKKYRHVGFELVEFKEQVP